MMPGRRARPSIRACAAALLTAAGAAAAPAERPHDPLEGMEESGRIPRAERPADLPNPERWRYVPEGRIKPGNVLERRLVSTFIVPFVFVESDVGVGGGVALTDIDFREQRRREFAGIFLSHTTKGQQAYRLAWRRWLHHVDLPEGGVLQEERSFLSAQGGYSKTLTRRFYGIGPETDEDDETSYTDEVLELGAGLDYALPRPGDDVVARIGARAELHTLAAGEVSGVPTTDAAHPALFDAARDADLGWLEAGVSYDTRDSQRNPYRGWEVSALAEGALLQSGGGAGARFTLSASRVFPVPGLFHGGGDAGEENPPTDTLAAGLWTQAAAGELPFFALPTLGGSLRHRGYIAGRWRDRAAWLGALEYRFWFLPRGFRLSREIRVERIGAALFYETGAVARDWPALADARLRHSYGVSLRMSLERAAPFRLDVGFSEEDVVVSGGFGLSF